MHFVAVHARHVKAVGGACGVEQGVVPGAFGAKAEVVADQHVPRSQTVDQHPLHKALRALGRQRGVERQHHHLVHTAVRQVGNLVPKGAHTRGRQVGLTGQLGEVVARVRLKGQHATGHAALLRLAAQQGQHGLVAPVHAVKVADGEGAGRGQPWVVEAAKNLHGILSF